MNESSWSAISMRVLIVYGSLIWCFCASSKSSCMHFFVHGSSLDSSSLVTGSRDSTSSSLFNLEITHRFSDKARRELQERYGDAFRPWPMVGSEDYHKMVWNRDLLRRRDRFLLSTDHALLTYSGGNLTEEWLDGLQYATVNIGTPSKAFFVILDTGSDLLWVPCANCISCSPTAAPAFEPIFSLGVYSPSLSSTYEPVTCKDPLCLSTSRCSKSTDDCPYEVDYVTPNTSTSGILVQDVIQFIPDISKGSGAPRTTASVTFGCGTNQTGSFLQGTGSDGLLGLGVSEISVPSTMARQGVTQNSFSMCFDLDLSGRIIFGDRGPPEQPRTPLVNITNVPAYVVNIEQITVGTSTVPAKIDAIFDTGTSLTYLSTPVYTQFAKAYISQVQAQRFSLETFELCYEITDPSILPSIALQFSNNATLNVAAPFVAIVNSMNQLVGYCLEVLDSGSSSSLSSIIGHNFMANHSITFDRVSMTIGWQQTSCYSIEAYSGPAAAPAPAPTPQLGPPTLPPVTNPSSVITNPLSPSLPHKGGSVVTGFSSLTLTLCLALLLSTNHIFALA
ncbi:unnamed protein product [Sphagnum compactum]